MDSSRCPVLGSLDPPGGEAEPRASGARRLTLRSRAASWSSALLELPTSTCPEVAEVFSRQVL